MPQPETEQERSPYKMVGLDRAIRACGYSCAGLAAAWRHESSFRQEVVLAAVMLPIALWLPVTALEKALLIATVLLVLIVELLNSSLEAIVDRISLERHELAGRAKDIGSAAVMLSLVLCVMVWAVIVWPVVR